MDVHPFSRQIEDREVVIGRQDTATYLSVPVEALEVLDGLASGSTVGEAQSAYERRHGEKLDLPEFLLELESRGLVRERSGVDQEADPPDVPAVAAMRYHFEWISPALARILVNRPAAVLGGIVALLALAAVVFDPGVVPGWRSLYFPEDTLAWMLAVMFLGLFTTFIHEMGHVIAARAAGVSCQFGLGNRLWFLVWETRMPGVWSLPRNRRYLPILAGPVVDLLTACAFILLLFAADQGWASLSPAAVRLVSALLFIYLMRLLWQCYFFLRTDFYYALSTFFGCKNLMGDTRSFLKDAWARVTGWGRRIDLGHIPKREMRIVHLNAAFFLLGRGAAFSVLLFVQLPLFYNYLLLVPRKLSSDSTEGVPLESILSAVFFTAMLSAGLWMWIRGMFRRAKG